MAPHDNTRDLQRALVRLTDDPGDQRRETTFYRITLTASDSHEASVTVDVSHHRKVPAPANLRAIADTWRIDRKEINTVLTTWTHAQLVAWLERFTRDQLLPLVIRKQRGIA